MDKYNNDGNPGALSKTELIDLIEAQYGLLPKLFESFRAYIIDIRGQTENLSKEEIEKISDDNPIVGRFSHVD